jgi:hypothetical protein
MTIQIEQLTAKVAKLADASEAAATKLAAARADLLAAMQAAELKSAQTPTGTVTVVAGRRSLRVTDRQLKAELTALQEAAVKDGRAVESYGAPYISLKR